MIAVEASISKCARKCCCPTAIRSETLDARCTVVAIAAKPTAAVAATAARHPGTGAGIYNQIPL